jgi:hypothetical protein
VNQFRCKQVKSTTVLGFKACETRFVTGAVEKALSLEFAQSQKGNMVFTVGDTFKPGEKVPHSGIYEIIHDRRGPALGNATH